MMDTEDLDKADMQALVNGKHEALDNLMSRHSSKVAGFLFRILQSTEAEDIAQDVFLRVFQYADKYDKRQKFSTWLFTIASNLAKNHKRWWNRHPADSIGDFEWEQLASPLSSPSDNATQVELRHRIKALIQDLPLKLRLPLILAEYEEKSQVEIAEILGCSVKSVESKLYRARKNLAKNLKNFLKE